MPVWSFPPPSFELLIAHLGQVHIFADDLPAEIHENFVDVSSPSSRGLIVWSIAPALRQFVRHLPRHRAVVLQIGLVTYDDEGDIRVVFDADDLLPQLGQFMQATHACNGEDQEESLALLHVQFAHGRELLCTCRIESGCIRLCIRWEGSRDSPYISRMH